MKIVLCNHAKNNYTNKYNGTNNNIVHDYNIIQVVFFILLLWLLFILLH